MFRKYEKTYRIPVPNVETGKKFLLKKKELQKLFTGKITITEKLDGANTGIIGTRDGFRLQKRGSLVDTSEHEQFNFFKSWSMRNYNNLVKIPHGMIVYGELLRCVHHVKYDLLPDWFLVFGIFDRRSKRYYNWDEVIDVTTMLNLHTVPLIAQDVYMQRLEVGELFDEIQDSSALRTKGPMEGIVVWNFRKQMRGKIIRSEFTTEVNLEPHWNRHPIAYHELKGG